MLQPDSLLSEPLQWIHLLYQSTEKMLKPVDAGVGNTGSRVTGTEGTQKD